jgi:hypothetical protein
MMGLALIKDQSHPHTLPGATASVHVEAFISPMAKIAQHIQLEIIPNVAS